MITIYHLSQSQSDRIVWLMEELELPYQLEWYDRLPSGFAPPEYKALHPVATAPTIRDGNVVLCESIAIVEYIINVHGNGRLGVSKDEPNYADYLYWLQFSASLMMTLAQILSVPATDVEPRLETVYLKSAKQRKQLYFGHLEQRLGESEYLAGPKFTGADIMNIFTLAELPQHGGPTIDHLPNVSAYVRRVTDRPAYKKAMQIAGPSVGECKASHIRQG